MYLFLFQDNSVKQVKDNLTVGDIVALSQKVLKIIRFNSVKNIFQMLIKDNERLVWIPIRDSNVIGCSESMFHQ